MEEEDSTLAIPLQEKDFGRFFQVDTTAHLIEEGTKEEEEEEEEDTMGGGGGGELKT
jgi:hypothetical protein